MYEVSGVYGIKLAPDGSILRTKKVFHVTLKTERGVTAFCDEQKPFAKIKIVDDITKEDKTEYFLGPSS